MALTIAASGTQTAIIGTEHTLSTKTDAHFYILVVDVAAMALGDALSLAIFTKCLSGGVSRLAYAIDYASAQTEPIKLSVPVPSDVEISCTLKQTAGTGRDYPWKLLSL